MLLLSIITAELITGLTVGTMSIVFRGVITPDYMITGALAALITSLIVVIIILDLMEQMKKEKERLQEAIAKVKALSGLLPICASCKKIRDDRGYWNQIESYIREHSEADFTHGICPDCIERLYPGF